MIIRNRISLFLKGCVFGSFLSASMFFLNDVVFVYRCTVIGSVVPVGSIPSSGDRGMVRVRLIRGLSRYRAESELNQFPLNLVVRGDRFFL